MECVGVFFSQYSHWSNVKKILADPGCSMCCKIDAPLVFLRDQSVTNPRFTFIDNDGGKWNGLVSNCCLSTCYRLPESKLFDLFRAVSNCRCGDENRRLGFKFKFSVTAIFFSCHDR